MAIKKVAVKKVAVTKSDAKKDAPVDTASSELQEKETTDTPIIRERWIAESAYYLAEARNFVAGYEQEDWNTAEQKYTKEVLV